MTQARSELLAVARGDTPADLVLEGGRVVNVFTGEVERVSVAVHGDRIAGLADAYDGKRVIDLEGRFLLPGFLDAHVHIESSMATPAEFARAVVPRGTTTVVSDPHEIANVHGLEGIRYMLEASEGLPLTVFVMASSCVPATSMGTAGANLTATDLVTLRDHPRVIGLAELMNFPGAIFSDPDVLAKVDAFDDLVVDGHAPGVLGKRLNAYAAVGPRSDHECTTPHEALEKLRRGLFVFFREATNARNLGGLLPALTPLNSRRIALCTDDRQPPDLLDEGGIDLMLRRVINSGVTPIEAIRLVTLNPAEYFRLQDRGAIAPGRRADLVVAEELTDLHATQVFCGGALVAEDGTAMWPPVSQPRAPAPSMSVDLGSIDLSIAGRTGRARIIEAIPDQIVTGSSTMEPPTVEGQVVSDPSRDLLKICVIERHRGTGNVGVGLVHGIGLERGAIAGTIAHDHHNIIAVGVEDDSLLRASEAVAEMGGGLAVVDGASILAKLPLPIGGLMSDRPIEEVRAGFDAVLSAARALGTPLHDPFMAMSFLGLEVIPSLKITDQGLVDVDAFQRVEFWVDAEH
jgi:adenine deaminase